MNLLLSLMIVAVAPEPSIEGHYPEATQIYHCAFDVEADKDYDEWPDYWRRQPPSPAYPAFVIPRIVSDKAPGGGRSLLVELKGGSAAAYSPEIDVGSLYDYVLEGCIRTEGLQHNTSFLSLNFLDEKKQPLETLTSERLRGTTAWTKVRLGPLSAGSTNARYAQIGVHVLGGTRSDLSGKVSFADIWFARLPRMTLAAEGGSHIVTDPNLANIHCLISGFTRPAPTVDFQLLDALGSFIARSDQPLRMEPARKEPARNEPARNEPARNESARNESANAAALKDPANLVGSAVWKPPIPGLGFYRVRVLMVGERAVVHRRELSIAVIESRRAAPGGEFGWSLPRANRSHSLPMMLQLVPQAGINWVKYPMWLSASATDAQSSEIVTFVEQLAQRGIQTVGTLDAPPEDVMLPETAGRRPTVADVFSLGREVWGPSLETTVARLAPVVHWWQLGRDADASFMGYPRLAEKIEQIKAEMDRFGSDQNIGLGWRWMHDLPETTDKKTPPWRFLTLAIDPPLTRRELSVYLAESKRAEVKRWVALDPLPREGYTLTDRAVDLVQRMIAAKLGRAEAVFVPEPFSTDHGLMNDDGTPGELFLPWRTTALFLGGSEPLGSITLPGESSNQVFARTDDAVMIAWNRKPVRETLYLGEDVRQTDLWGRPMAVQKAPGGQAVEIGPQPTFITGLQKEVTQWRFAFTLASDRMPSISGQRHANRFEIRNVFSQGIEGVVSLVGPSGWIINPSRTPFRLGLGETMSQPFDVLLPGNASSGPQMLRADVEIHADRDYQFSAYRPIHVGLGDVRIEVLTQLNAAGELEVQQRMINDTTQPTSFRCQLFAPERRRLSTQVIGLGRDQDVKTYRLPNGKQLLGKTLWLQAEEIGGPRVLNYRFAAEP